jgi:hypothetical protein
VHDVDNVRSVRDAMAYWVRVELRVVVAGATTGRAAVPYVEADAKRLLG